MTTPTLPPLPEMRTAFESSQSPSKILFKRGGGAFAENVDEADYVDDGIQSAWKKFQIAYAAGYTQARTDTLAELVPVAWIMNGFHVIDRKGVADTLRRAGEKIEQLAVIPKA